MATKTNIFLERAGRCWLAEQVLSETMRIFTPMTETQSGEVEKVLLHISDARSRAHRAADICAKDGAEEHIVAALNDAEQQLAELHRKLSQGTYYAVPNKPLKLAV